MLTLSHDTLPHMNSHSKALIHPYAHVSLSLDCFALDLLHVMYTPHSLAQGIATNLRCDLRCGHVGNFVIPSCRHIVAEPWVGIRDTKSRLSWAASWRYRHRWVPKGRWHTPSHACFMISLLVVSSSHCDHVSYLYVVLQRVDGLHAVICPRFVYGYLLYCDRRCLPDSEVLQEWYDDLFLALAV